MWRALKKTYCLFFFVFEALKKKIERERGLKYENLGAASIEHSFNISQPLTQVFQNSVMVEHKKGKLKNNIMVGTKKL